MKKFMLYYLTLPKYSYRLLDYIENKIESINKSYMIDK